MITKNIIKVKMWVSYNKPTRVYLSAKTNKGNYGQCYNLTDKKAANYVPDLGAAKQRFMEFYNQFE